MRILIKNGIVVNSDSTTAADILIQDRTISAVDSGLSATGVDQELRKSTVDEVGAPASHKCLPRRSPRGGTGVLVRKRIAFHQISQTILSYYPFVQGEH